ncbi:type III secretion system protein [Burkholderia sp. WAC0059]|uniref:type III secretion system protein n=1 Tax=Burkholderia sp. WAC0059 TaxID=2066022 RepID=UPI000C7F5629|nr:type III secretion system protein [Burkholderia sp. WAC0059]PLZ00297.1 type III secretion system protein [Burkholderia sp. WAC0059]
MKDRSLEAFGVVLARRRRLDRKLNESLSALNAEEAGLEEQETARRAELAAQTAKLEAQDARIAAMRTGDVPFSVREFNECRRYRDVLGERCGAFEAQWRQARDALAAKQDEVAKMRKAILANQSRIEVYDGRVVMLRRLAEQRADEAQDEEAGESRRRGGARLFGAGESQRSLR